MARSKLPWSDEQRATLRRAWLDPTLSLREVSTAVGWSEDACTNQAMRDGLPIRATIRDPDLYRYRPAPVPRGPQARPLRPGERSIPLLPSELAAKGEG